MVIHGDKWIPFAGPGLVVFNHYFREGFSIIFAAAALAAVVPLDMHWVMTSGWTFPGRPFARQLRIISEWVFRWIARVYDFTLTPPNPPDSADEHTRTAAVRRVFQHIKAHPACLVALAPEGRDFPGGVLGAPPPGSGKFLLELDRRLGSIHPVGIYEEDDSLHLHFGQPFELCSIINPDNTEEDRDAAVEVMRRIALLLPASLAGKYHA